MLIWRHLERRFDGVARSIQVAMAPRFPFYVTFMPRRMIIISSLGHAPYVRRMAFRACTSERKPTAAWFRLRSGERMSHWRWLLFAAMARVERPEGPYLRIPSAKTLRHDVTVDLYSDREMRR